MTCPGTTSPQRIVSIRDDPRAIGQHSWSPGHGGPGRTCKGSVMRKYWTGMMLAAVLGFLASASLATPSLAETGALTVVFTKGGFIVGVGGGKGVLTFRGKHYPFTV